MQLPTYTMDYSKLSDDQLKAVLKTPGLAISTVFAIQDEFVRRIHATLDSIAKSNVVMTKNLRIAHAIFSP